MTFDIISENLGGRWSLTANRTLNIYCGQLAIFDTDIELQIGEKYQIKPSLDLLNKNLFIAGDFVKDNRVYVVIANFSPIPLYDREKLIFGARKESLNENFNIGLLIEL